MDQINSQRHDLSLRKSLVLYIIVFVVLALILSVATFSVCGVAAERIRASYPTSGEKYYLTNEQGEQFGEGTYIGKSSALLSEQDERTIAMLETLPVVVAPVYFSVCIICLLYTSDAADD